MKDSVIMDYTGPPQRTSIVKILSLTTTEYPDRRRVFSTSPRGSSASNGTSTYDNTKRCRTSYTIRTSDKRWWCQLTGWWSCVPSKKIKTTLEFYGIQGDWVSSSYCGPTSSGDYWILPRTWCSTHDVCPIFTSSRRSCNWFFNNGVPR